MELQVETRTILTDQRRNVPRRYNEKSVSIGLHDEFESLEIDS